MSRFRFLHCADLHLDSPLRGIENDPSAPVERIRRATRVAVTRMVDLAITEAVHFVVIAGDLFDGDWRDVHTGRFMWSEMARLHSAGIPVFAIAGNHDAASKLTRPVDYPTGFKMFPAKPWTETLEDLGVAIHGQSYAKAATTENIALAYPPAEPGYFNIGLLHTSLEGGYDGHENYAPCTASQLAGHGYQYWALGHVHTRLVVARDPWIVFPGVLQGRQVRERGPKGVFIVSVDGMEVSSVDPHDVDDVRFEVTSVDIEGVSDLSDAVETIRAALDSATDQADGRLVVSRVVLHGRSKVHPVLALDPEGFAERIRTALVGDVSRVWLKDVQVRTLPDDGPEALRQLSDAVDRLLDSIEGATPESLSDTAKDYVSALLGKESSLRAELGPEHPVVLAANGELSKEIVDRARNLLLGQLGAQTP